MKFADFDLLLKNRLKTALETASSKGGEYSGDQGDRLHNFKIAKRIGGYNTIKQALKGMKLKHDVSIDDMIHDRVEITPAMVREKITDEIVYLCLLEAMCIDDIAKKRECSIQSVINEMNAGPAGQSTPKEKRSGRPTKRNSGRPAKKK